jgi:hypothetical protein
MVRKRGKDIVLLLFPGGSRVKDKETPDDQVEAGRLPAMEESPPDR